MIFSDDLSMAAASSIGGFIERAEAAQQAGCDMLLVCNDRDAQIKILDHANLHTCNYSTQRLSQLMKSTQFTWSEMQNTMQWQNLHQVINQETNHLVNRI